MRFWALCGLVVAFVAAWAGAVPASPPSRQSEAAESAPDEPKTPGLNFLLANTGDPKAFLASTLERHSGHYPRRPQDEKEPMIFSFAGLDEVLQHAVSANNKTAEAMLAGKDCMLVKRIQKDGEWWSGSWPGNTFNESTIREAFKRGFTVVINKMDARYTNLGFIAATLERELGVSVQANMYLTPPSTQGFEHHFDPMETFVIQVEGRKKWRVYDSLITLPRQEQKYKPNVSEVEALKVTHEVEVGPGDLLYMPRGVVHEAFATPPSPSMHITFGIDNQFSTYEAVAHVAVKRLSLPTPTLSVTKECSIPWRVMLHIGVWRAANDNVALRRVFPLTPVLVQAAGGEDAVKDQWQEVLALIAAVDFKRVLKFAYSYVSAEPRKFDSLLSTHIHDFPVPKLLGCQPLIDGAEGLGDAKRFWELLMEDLTKRASLRHCRDTFAAMAKDRLVRLQKIRTDPLQRHKQRPIPAQ